MKKLILSLIVLVVTALSSWALEHTVQRGETLESIARLYNVSVQDLIKENRDCDRLFYVGMKLYIPEAPAQPATSMTDTSTTHIIDDSANMQQTSTQESGFQNQTSTIQNSNEIITPNDFSNVFVSYSAKFDHFDLGSYEIGWVTYNEKGWGGIMAIDANYGIVKHGSLSYRFGAAYGDVIHPNIMLNCSLTGFVNFYDDPETSDLKTGGGILLTPGISFRANRFVLGLSYDLGVSISKKSSFGHNFRATVGYKF